MKIGLIARAEQRGLGIQTLGFHDHMHPDRTVLINMGALSGAFRMHREWYPDAELTRFDGNHLTDIQPVRSLLAACDVVYTAETPYDPRFFDWARELRCGVVVHVNPEFNRWDAPVPGVTFWNPTSWRMCMLPHGTKHVPVPVDLSLWPTPAPLRDECVFLHVAGHLAAQDRNGTRALWMALRHVQQPTTVRVITQDPRLPPLTTRRAGVTVERVLGGVPDVADVYADADVLVMPRRYGGLCLPVQEGAAAGLGLVMPDLSPNPGMWPCATFPAPESKSRVNSPAGPIIVHEPSAPALAALMDSMADPTVRHGYQRMARVWAESHSWSALEATIRAELEAATY